MSNTLIQMFYLAEICETYTRFFILWHCSQFTVQPCSLSLCCFSQIFRCLLDYVHVRSFWPLNNIHKWPYYWHDLQARAAIKGAWEEEIQEKNQDQVRLEMLRKMEVKNMLPKLILIHPGKLIQSGPLLSAVPRRYNMVHEVFMFLLMQELTWELWCSES